MHTSLKCMAILLALIATPANAGTRVWGFYGAGFEAWSSGVDEIAAQARTIPNVEFVHVYNYYDTQRVADEISATPSGTRTVVYGYSCGGNASTVVGTAFYGHRNIDAVIGMQPSVWCGGGYEAGLTQNILYAQNTFAPCWQTLGLGCQQWYGARRVQQFRRPSRHLYADTDPAYQQDVLSAIASVAGYAHECSPSRHYCHSHALVITRTGRTLVHY